MKRSLRHGEHNVWISATAVALTLLMVGLLLVVIAVNGLGYFWPKRLAVATLLGGKQIMGEITATEPGAGADKPNLQFKVGNRDMYGQDFRWIKGETVTAVAYPPEAVRLEREEFGNFYGTLLGMTLPGLRLPPLPDDWVRFTKALREIQALTRALRERREELGGLARESEALRLRMRGLLHEGLTPRHPRVAGLERRIARLQGRFEEENARLSTQTEALGRNTATFREIGGKAKEIPLMNIVLAVRPNAMSTTAKLAFYGWKVFELLTGEPRESNTEGGLFPAIFGTVLMVIIMSIFSLPMGVVAAIYLREYAREGLLVRLVRIAVYNLAGVPSIVFGVFGLGFFVYGVGKGIDVLFFPEALPAPTFGTGGILWASLTLALLTVPVVIVATEEGLSAIPRGLREASLALGATRFQTLVRVVMPMAVPGIITGFILAMARAAGEVAPLMITGVVKLAPSLAVDGTFPYLHLERKFMHLGFHIFDVGFQSPNVEAAKPMVYITTLLLILIVLILSLTAIVLRNRMRKRFQTSAF